MRDPGRPAMAVRHCCRDQDLPLRIHRFVPTHNGGNMIQEVCPCGTPNSAPST